MYNPVLFGSMPFAYTWRHIVWGWWGWGWLVGGGGGGLIGDKSLQSNAVSHWRGANLKSAMPLLQVATWRWMVDSPSRYQSPAASMSISHLRYENRTCEVQTADAFSKRSCDFKTHLRFQKASATFHTSQVRFTQLGCYCRLIVAIVNSHIVRILELISWELPWRVYRPICFYIYALNPCTLFIISWRTSISP